MGSRGSHRKAVHQHATLPLRPFLATIVLSLTLVGLVTKAFIPGMIDDFARLMPVDPGSATTDDSDDDGKLSPDDDFTKCKFGGYTEAILVIVDVALPHLLIPVHGLVVCDAATEPLLPDHFLPNAETGPPVVVRSPAAGLAGHGYLLLGSLGTASIGHSRPVNSFQSAANHAFTDANPSQATTIEKGNART